MKRVRKAVFPVAGLGTRFLPATKAVPKEMLTVVDRPVIQYVVDEAREAGIEHFIFVTGRNKAVIEDHFDIQFELDHTLAQRGKDDQLAKLQRLQPLAGQTSFTRQQEPLGLGHAVWCARELVGDEPFALLLPDMIMQSREELPEGDGGALRAHRRQHRRGAGMRCRRGAQIRHRRQGRRHPQRFCDHRDGGEAETGHGPLEPVHQRPLHPAARDLRHPGEAGARRRQRDPADGRHAEAGEGAGFLRLPLPGRTFDCGSPEGFVEANVAFALTRPDLSTRMADAIASLLDEAPPSRLRQVG